MSVSILEVSVPEAETVNISGDALTAELSDGRTISVPLDWYPRLTYATPEERDNWRLIGAGEGIHWPDLDEGYQRRGPHRRAPVRRKPEVIPALARGQG